MRHFPSLSIYLHAFFWLQPWQVQCSARGWCCPAPCSIPKIVSPAQHPSGMFCCKQCDCCCVQNHCHSRAVQVRLHCRNKIELFLPLKSKSRAREKAKWQQSDYAVYFISNLFCTFLPPAVIISLLRDAHISIFFPFTQKLGPYLFKKKNKRNPDWNMQGKKLKSQSC